jgi:hypothetical protein
MFHALQIVTVVLISVAMALSLAHALEFPGKRRLAKEAYHAMQSVYYPGFTIGGAVGEYGGLLLLIILLLQTPSGSAELLAHTGDGPWRHRHANDLLDRYAPGQQGLAQGRRAGPFWYRIFLIRIIEILISERDT